MRKEDKSAIIAQLGELIKKYPHFYLVDVEGMNAADTSALRRQCFKSNLKMVLVKNTLLEKTLEAMGHSLSNGHHSHYVLCICLHPHRPPSCPE